MSLLCLKGLKLEFFDLAILFWNLIKQHSDCVRKFCSVKVKNAGLSQSNDKDDGPDGRVTESSPSVSVAGGISVTYRLAYRQNKRLDSIPFHYR